MSMQVKVFKGYDILPYVPILADMRLKAFCEFPYLYGMDRETELQHATEYTLSPHGLLVLSFKDEQITGLVSGMPLNVPGSGLARFGKMLTHRGIDVDTTYYAGEIIVEPTFQGQRSCSLLISHFMEAVREMKFSHMLWVSSLRGQEHPLCPSNYVEPTSIWRKIGGHKTDITLSIKWPTYQVDGSIKEESNPIVCWMKEMSL